ncbi:MAG: UDP-N-acetylmuramoyl-tripeptide--D-alanyl-D-alanine ligase [Sporomusaceae bacterium]|nr:UDP-N-acetylmuramoyl-tripeptide--D-alanyl-D-alanine ligase [Sporomusaceae bacterium]
MAEFTIDEVCLATKGKVCSEPCSEKFIGICTDTRKVKSGDLFIPLVGETFDGHDFIDQAVKNGAKGILSSRPDIVVPSNIILIMVDDTLMALQGLARFHRQRFTIPIIAITGSNGKTTTKDMTAAILSSQLNVLKTEANYNNEIGLPLTLLQLTEQHEVAVVEMGMRGAGQIRQLARIALPTIAIITNVGETHIELLGSIEAIAAAKAELLEVIPANGLTILNADDHYVREMAKQVRSRVTLFGLEQGNIKADQIQNNIQGMDFECHSAQGEFSIHVPTIGKHNIYNALAAIAAGLEVGLTAEDISCGLRTFNASPMRLHVEAMGDYIIINDAYNASPMSMTAAIDTLVEVAKGRKVVVLGDMLELGDIGAAAHRQIGEKLAQCRIDIVVTVGMLASYTAQAAIDGGIAAVACYSHNEASEALKKLIKPSDTILIKGSRGMKMENMVKMFL